MDQKNLLHILNKNVMFENIILYNRKVRSVGKYNKKEAYFQLKSEDQLRSELVDLLMDAESYSKESKEYQQIKEKIQIINEHLNKKR